MKKTKKVLSIIGIILLIVLAITYIVLYCIYPINTKQITMDVVDYICNKPLPVVGVSTLIVCIFIWKIFASSSLGKFQINRLKGICDETNANSKETKDLVIHTIENLQKQLDEKQEEIDNLKELLKEICKCTPNLKVKAIGTKLGEKEDDSETKAKEI